MFNPASVRLSTSGLSVSRVGGAAQIKAIKKIAAPIRVELVQYRELASFRPVQLRVDAATTEQPAQGERIREVLKQPPVPAMPVEYQVIIIYAATRKHLLDIPVADVLAFEKDLFKYIDSKYPEIPAATAIPPRFCLRRPEALLVKAIKECKEQR